MRSAHWSEPQHWYSLSFAWVAEPPGTFGFCDVRVSRSVQWMPEGTIAACKVEAVIPTTASLIACSYLGYMTGDEYRSGSEVVNAPKE